MPHSRPRTTAASEISGDSLASQTDEMAAESAYRRFLAAPSSSMLAEDATLAYITTTTSFTGATDIIKHFSTLRHQVRNDSEEVVDVIATQSSLWMEVVTTVQFVTSGGVYLPGLDDNFLADSSVVIPIQHVVRFDPDGKIKWIRQTWDQGCLLKQVEVIGRTGRNWPIRGARDQIKMVEKLQGKARATEDWQKRARSTSDNVMRDPHASLSLFSKREDVEAATPVSVISPKNAGSRPRQRSFAEILGDHPGDGLGGLVSISPSKRGAGKNFAPNRLFEAQEELAEEPETPPGRKRESLYRPHPTKYNHFDFADGTEPQDSPKRGVDLNTRPKTRHDSSWGFEDFVTPQKALPTRFLGRRQDRVHWSTVVDEAQETPVSKPAAPPKARRDNETHFQFVDDGEPDGNPRLVSRRGGAQNDGLGLYKDNLYGGSGQSPEQGPTRALDNITNLKDRVKDFEPQFALTDDSPRVQSRKQMDQLPDDRRRAVKMMDANWESYDESPKQQKENLPMGQRDKGGGGGRKLAPEEGGRVYQVSGDGMGGKKGSRGWSIGDSDDDDGDVQEAAAKPTRRQHGQQHGQHGQQQQQQQAGGSFSWEF